ncbi:DUF4233 domain-containing protein [Subtercola endophyticus]|uniref:DUF4233 domain-containing protein n=1 Tax=Subtercola endophyticus TaxID=2895559 RepID=UPI001E43321D|nr:DUF4233 domain-containing protein [Subtercola endophyticus]UFS60857.1 DUF4233 domain-containing protein [Subtercola endophyticus]
MTEPAGGSGAPDSGAPDQGGRASGGRRGPRTPRTPRMRVRRQRSVQESLGSIVLGFQVIIVGLAALVAFGLHKLPPLVALGGGAVATILLLATIPLLRYRAGFVIGWVLQVALLATALLVPQMLIVAVLFGGMWAFCMIRGSRIDRDNKALAAARAAEDDTLEP